MNGMINISYPVIVVYSKNKETIHFRAYSKYKLNKNDLEEYIIDHVQTQKLKKSYKIKLLNFFDSINNKRHDETQIYKFQPLHKNNEPAFNFGKSIKRVCDHLLDKFHPKMQMILIPKSPLRESGKASAFKVVITKRVSITRNHESVLAEIKDLSKRFKLENDLNTSMKQLHNSENVYCDPDLIY
jgi:hypothetical protein